jgi:hypothetical protein
VVGTENLLKHATNYYKTLFGLGAGNVFELDPNLWQDEECLNTSDNADLTKQFFEEEIKIALFQIEKNKAARPDGFPIEFYQSCWDIIKKDIIEIFK